MILPFTVLGQEFFKFTPPTPLAFLLIIAIVIIYLFMTESIKLLYYRLMGNAKTLNRSTN
jgi:hypothetical protein